MYPARLTALALAAAFAVGTAHADVPVTRLPRSLPEEQGVSAKGIFDFVTAAEERVDAFHSFILVRHGVVVAEGWWAPYAADQPHEMYSLSKSFTSTAVGLAIGEGRMSLDDKVISFFPEYVPENPSENLRNLRVRDLLRMSSGQLKEDVEGFPLATAPQALKLFLSKPVVYKPGTHFVYNTPGTYTLSAIVQKVTGMTVADYLAPRLFEPLGMAHPTWDKSLEGVSLGGTGLHMVTENIAKFGLLYLQRGEWQGRQIVPAAWVDAATSLQTSNGGSPDSDWDQGYGYQFWRCRHGFFRGDGAFGQLCIVMPEYDAVFAATCGTGDMQGELNTVWEKIIPAFSKGPLPMDAHADQMLAARLAALTLKTVQGVDAPAGTGAAVRRYAFGSNPLHLEALAYVPGGGSAPDTFRLRIAGRDQDLSVGNRSWIKGVLDFGDGGPVPVAASGGWTPEGTYKLVIAKYQTPYIATETLSFRGDALSVAQHMNVGFNGNPDLSAEGTLAR